MAAQPHQSSVLLQSIPQPVAHDKTIYEARKKFVNSLDDELLDYKHNHPVTVETCVCTLMKIFSNVINSPNEQKFRQIKASSKVFQRDISKQKGGEHLMLLAGWTTQVIELEKHWIFLAEDNSTKFRILQECYHALEKAMHAIHDKAERKKHEDEQRKAKQAEERERIRLQIEDDKVDRKLRNELTAAQPRLSQGSDTASQPDAVGAGSTSPRMVTEGGHVLGGAIRDKVES